MKRKITFVLAVLPRGDTGVRLEYAAEMCLVVKARLIGDSREWLIIRVQQLHRVKKFLIGDQLFCRDAENALRLPVQMPGRIIHLLRELIERRKVANTLRREQV